MTLLDYPGKVACTVFLTGCNLRCPYCHNGGLVLPERMEGELPEGELLEFLAHRKGKLDGVCVTGGEPTVQRDLPELLERIRDLGFSVKLDTNGSNPRMVRDLIDRGLVQYLAMDIKNCREAYGITVGGVEIADKVEQSLVLLRENRIPYELRTTVCKPLHSPERMRQLARWIAGTEHYYLQNFADTGNLVGTGMSAFSHGEMLELLEAAREFVPGARIRGE